MSMSLPMPTPMIKRRHRSRSAVAAMCVLAGCALYIVSCVTNPSLSYHDDEADGGHLDFISGGQRLLRSTGPALTGFTGQVFKVHDEEKHKGVTWYNVLSSPRLQWNMAPHHWKSCPKGEDVFLGETGFTFHEPNPLDPTKMKSKYLRFRVERKDDRSCTWNYSKSCLAGGNFIMNFGKEARDVLHPGDYSLKTDDGVIRIIAYNTNRACSRKGHGSTPAKEEGGGEQSNGAGGNEKRPRQQRPDVTTAVPMDYIRQARSSTLDPKQCQEWIEERKEKDDLFSYNSDMATVHIDTPWTQIIIQVRQNKVATKTTCNYANMNIWIVDMSTGLLEESTLDGALGGESQLGSSSSAATDDESILKSRALREGQVHEVDGPFGV